MTGSFMNSTGGYLWSFIVDIVDSGQPIITTARLLPCLHWDDLPDNRHTISQYLYRKCKQGLLVREAPGQYRLAEGARDRVRPALPDRILAVLDTTPRSTVEIADLVDGNAERVCQALASFARRGIIVRDGGRGRLVNRWYRRIPSRG